MMILQKRFFSLHNIIYLLAVIILDLVLSYLVIVKGTESIYKENSWIENMQVVFLSVSWILYFVSAIRLEGKNRIICFFFSMLSFIFMFREVDVDKLDVPQLMIFMLAEDGRAFFFVILLGLLFSQLRKFSHYWQNRHHYFASDTFVYITIAALLLIIFSSAFDQKVINVKHRVYYEELVEMTAYLMMVGAAIFSYADLNAISRSIDEGKDAF